MNNTRRVFLFTMFAFVALLIFSFLPNLKLSGYTFKNIDLFSDIRKDGEKKNAEDSQTVVAVPDTLLAKEEPKAFDDYVLPGKIINFSTNKTQPTIQRFIEKLIRLKSEQKGKVRIAFMGDSMIEGDLLTQDFRTLLQHEFGGRGVGFVPVNDIAASNRITADSRCSKDWIKRNYKSDRTDGLFISGNVFNSGGSSWLTVTDNTITDPVQVSLLYGKGSGTIISNDQQVALSDDDLFNVKQLDIAKSISIKVANQNIPMFGTSFESENGVIVDNFSFRGISGVEINKLNSTLLSEVNSKRPYDLIVLEYGVNVLFRPNDTNFDWYYKLMLPSIKKLKAAFPDADILLISAGDRAFRYPEGWASAKGVTDLVKTQALMAFDEKLSFLNLYETMGGRNSIVEWANSSPPMANKDYVHPNHNGAKKIAGLLFDAVMHEMNKVNNSTTEQRPQHD